MPRLDPHESLGFHCGLTFRSFAASVEKKLKGTGVSPAQFIALAHLVALGPLSQTELVDRLSVTKATGVKLVDRMVRDGWVVRQEDPDDGRVRRVVPTDRALAVWDSISRAGREVLDQAYRGIHPSEIETVKRVLERVRRNLEQKR